MQAVQLVKKLYVGHIVVQTVLFSEGQDKHLLFENPKVGHKEHKEAVVKSAQFRQFVPFHMYPGHNKQ